VSDSTSNNTIGAVPRQPRLSDRVAEHIIETIVARRLQPGDVLPPERELGEQFGVSRTVIREAVRALDARGLLDVRVGSRIRVASVDPDTVRDAIRHFVRSRAIDERSISEASDAVALAIAELAAERATETDIDRMKRALADSELAFRRELSAAGHNELLTVLFAALWHLPSQSEPGAPRDARHDALLAAVSRHDSEGARRAMRDLLGERAGAATAEG
jgi:GntR family transcriptional repressor for pyruvate dehydrogenase complex